MGSLIVRCAFSKLMRVPHSEIHITAPSAPLPIVAAPFTVPINNARIPNFLAVFVPASYGYAVLL